MARVPVDAALAVKQWEQYVEVFRSRGWTIIEVEPADAHPDGVFIEDALVVFDDLIVICRAGAASRRGEATTATSAAERLGLQTGRITAPATVEGGDVLTVGRTVYVGRSTRTNAAGIAQLRHLLQPRGWTVLEVPVTKMLHLKSAVTALPDGTIVGYPPLVDDPSLFPRFLSVPEAHGSAVVVLDPASVIMSADAPHTAALLHQRGLTVVTTPVTEFEKLEGCVTCLSVRLRGPSRPH